MHCTPTFFYFSNQNFEDMDKPLIVHGVEYPKKFLIEVCDNGDVYLNGKQITPITLAHLGQGIAMLSEGDRPKKQIHVVEKRKTNVIDFDKTFDLKPDYIWDRTSGIYVIGENPVYVGRSGVIKDRLRSHVVAALNNAHSNTALQDYIISTIKSGMKVKVEWFGGLNPDNHDEGMIMYDMINERGLKLMNVDLTNLNYYSSKLKRSAK